MNPKWFFQVLGSNSALISNLTMYATRFTHPNSIGFSTSTVAKETLQQSFGHPGYMGEE
jgi:hypothetical protein